MCGGGGGGGDGGAADRKSAEDARQKEAIYKLNTAFGHAKPVRPERSQFTSYRAIPPAAAATDHENTFPGSGGFQLEEIFDADAFNAALREFDAAPSSSSTLDKRKALYAKFANDSKDFQLNDLTKQRDVARRETGFDIARRGLTGGSRQIDSETEIGNQFNKGVIEAATNAQNIANSAEQSDEKTRMNLIAGIRGGMDEADAISGALNGMSTNAANAANQANRSELNGFFDEIRSQAQQRQRLDQYQQAFQKSRSGGGSGYNGDIQNVG